MPTLGNVADDIWGPEKKGGPVFEEDVPSTATTPGTLYKGYVADPASDFLKLVLGKTGMSEGTRDFIVGAIVPQTLAQAGADVGAIMVPGGAAVKGASKALPFLKRLVGPAVGGAIGGYLEEYDPEKAELGAVMGLGQAALGNALTIGTKWISKSRVGQQLAKTDPVNLDLAVKKVIKDFPDIKTPEGFQAAVYGGYAQRRMSDAYETELGRIGSAVNKAIAPGERIKAYKVLGETAPVVGPGGRITSAKIRQMQKQGLITPEVNAQGMPSTTFDSLTKDIRDLRLTGRAASGDPKVTLQGKQAQEAAEALSQEVEGALSGISPGLAKRYQDMEHTYRRGAEMLRFVEQPGMIQENGRINMRALQEAFREERAAGINRTFTPQEVKTLQDAIFRGAPATAVDQLLKKGSQANIRVHGGAGGVRPNIFTNLLDLFRHDEYVGSYKAPFPNLSPKAATVGVGMVGGGLEKALSATPQFSTDRAVTLGTDED